MRFSINCSVVICSPTVIHAILREATSETYGSRVSFLLYYISFIYITSRLLFCNLYFSIYNKNTKNIYLIIFIRSHFCKWQWRYWQPLYCVGCEVLVCLCRCMGLLRSLLLDWYLGSQKLREILMLLCCITLSSSRKTNASSRRGKRNRAYKIFQELKLVFQTHARVKRYETSDKYSA